MSISCIALWALVLLLLPALILAWALETPTDRARRWRADGLSQARIAERLGVSRYKVRKMLAT